MATYIRLTDYKDSDSKKEGFFDLKNRYTAHQNDFEKIPGSPIAYWVSEKIANSFDSQKVSELCETRLGMATADNNKFLRFWTEISKQNIGLGFDSRNKAKESGLKWFPYQKGGEYRKWYGNNEYVVNWENDGNEIMNFKDTRTGKIRSHNYNLEFIFHKGITWNALSSNVTSMRLLICSLFDNAGSSMFPYEEKNLFYILSFMNTKIMPQLIKAISPTMNYQPGDIASLPIIFPKSDSIKQQIDTLTQECIAISKEEWDSRETSWDFTASPLLIENGELRIDNGKIEDVYNNYCRYWKEKFYKLHANEEELNRLFIDIYGLGDELTPVVELKDITILKSESIINDNNQLEFRADEIMKQFISYAVGVMFGRYSLGHDGLHIANMNESIEEANQKFNIQNSAFSIDEDNVIPILDGEWFIDDISERFFQFVKVTFGKESYESNLDFIASSLSDKNKNSVETIRKYFLKDFYADHIKRYKKRPIYWMISSPKGSFQALIYMHRYKSDTMSVVLNDYLREFITKLEATRENLEAVSIKSDASGSEKTKALKEIENIKKMIKELREFEKDVLYPLATQKLEIDLDDGVKVNYPKFGSALKKIVGLDSGE